MRFLRAYCAACVLLALAFGLVVVVDRIAWGMVP